MPDQRFLIKVRAPAPGFSQLTVGWIGGFRGPWTLRDAERAAPIRA